jgi:hypothetical protein
MQRSKPRGTQDTVNSNSGDRSATYRHAKESVKWPTITVGQNTDTVSLLHLQFHVIEMRFKMSFETVREFNYLGMLVKNMCDDIWVIPMPKNGVGHLVFAICLRTYVQIASDCGWQMSALEQTEDGRPGGFLHFTGPSSRHCLTHRRIAFGDGAFRRFRSRRNPRCVCVIEPVWINSSTAHTCSLTPQRSMLSKS